MIVYGCMYVDVFSTFGGFNDHACIHVYLLNYSSNIHVQDL